MFSNAADARKAGWFSRRHQSNDANLAARETRLLREEDKKRSALARQANWAEMSFDERVMAKEEQGYHYDPEKGMK